MSTEATVENTDPVVWRAAEVMLATHCDYIYSVVREGWASQGSKGEPPDRAPYFTNGDGTPRSPAEFVDLAQALDDAHLLAHPLQEL